MNFHTGDQCISRYFEVPGHGEFSERTFDELLARIARCRLDLKDGKFPGERRWRRTLKTLTGGRTALSQRRARLQLGVDTVVWKDPFATFCLERVLDYENVKVVVCFRGPNELAASFKRVGWRFSHADVQGRIDSRLHVHVQDPVDDGTTGALRPAHRGALFWAQAYNYLWHHAQRSDRVRFVEISRLVKNPEYEYTRLFSFCGIEFDSSAASAVRKRHENSSRSSGGVHESNQTHVRNRDVSTIGSYWRDVLDPGEVEFTRRHCRSIESAILESPVFV